MAPDQGRCTMPSGTQQPTKIPKLAQIRGLLALVVSNIALQLVNASLIKYASDHAKTQAGLVIIVLALVTALSFGRFVVWGAMHKRFPVSIAYPATALFFPCLVVIAAAYGEHVSFAQVLGACLVTLGVVLLLRPSRARQDESLT
jgi:drug/metabolite transporter (DMT)-like permease